MKYIILAALGYPSFKISLHKHQQVDVVLWQKGETDQHFLIVKIKRVFEEKNLQTFFYFTIILAAQLYCLTIL